MCCNAKVDSIPTDFYKLFFCSNFQCQPCYFSWQTSNCFMNAVEQGLQRKLGCVRSFASFIPLVSSVLYPRSFTSKCLAWARPGGEIQRNKKVETLSSQKPFEFSFWKCFLWLLSWYNSSWSCKATFESVRCLEGRAVSPYPSLCPPFNFPPAPPHGLGKSNHHYR